MTIVYQVKRSETSSSTPGSGDLAVGELALNLTDAKIFSKKSDGTIVSFNTTTETPVFFADEVDLGNLTTATNTYDMSSLDGGSPSVAYTAGTGLDLAGTTFSIEADLRDGITHVGLDTDDYISFTNNTQIDFYINGSNQFRMEANGDFHADGDLIAYSTTTSSDIRLKEDINVVGNALEKLHKLDGVEFKWKRDGKASAGVIAQQVQEVLPQAVKQVKDLNGEEHLSVNYSALTSVLIEAIKELTAKVDRLEVALHNKGEN